MLDAHCHLDLYPDPTRESASAERAGVFTVLVTNLPSAYERAAPHVTHFRKIRLAVGLHPLCVEQHSAAELVLFREKVHQTSFIGEVGLDFSREGLATKEQQIESFTFVLKSLESAPKFVSIHSRRAEQAVLELLSEHYQHKVVFHWFTGTMKSLNEIVDQGHYFSVNPAMVNTAKGLSLIAQIPPEQVLTESDGPFVTVGSRSAVPSDVAIVCRKLTALWGLPEQEVHAKVTENFHRLLNPIKVFRQE